MLGESSGYSIKGTPATCKRNYSPWGPRYNVVAAISTEGRLAIRIFDAGVTVGADQFLAFAQNDLHLKQIQWHKQSFGLWLIILGHAVHMYIYTNTAVKRLRMYKLSFELRVFFRTCNMEC